MNNKEILKQLIEEANSLDAEELAENLDSRGVIALPVRIGNLVFAAIGKCHSEVVDGKMFLKSAIDELTVTEVSSRGFWAGGKYFPYGQIGLNVFFFRENAERAAAFWLGKELGKMDERVQKIQKMCGGGNAEIPRT